MNKYIHCLSIILLLILGQHIHAQEIKFTPPFVFPILFSGNFGEIRTNHFHGGLDFKTQGVIRKPMRALADGYISHIRVTHGSGYMLDVVYENGYTTICRHLDDFIGEMAQRVKAIQYEQENWEVEIVPEPDEYPVKAGQVIALSGNTGYSFGPHLHLDMIETESGDYIDPLPFFAPLVKDHTAPRAESYMLFPQPGQGVVNGKQEPHRIATRKQQPVTAWGIIGAGIEAYDYMEGAYNKYGVHTVILEVDSVEIFRSVVDRFANEENLYINSWTYDKCMKSFIDPGNPLRMLHAKNNNRGLITIDEERPYKFHYILSDVLGNTSHAYFTIHGKRSEIAPMPQREKHIFRWDKVNFLQEPGLELLVPKGRLYEDAYLDYAVKADSGDIAFTYQLSKRRIPMHDYADLKISLRQKPAADSNKYYIVSVNERGKKYYVGGKCENGVITARIRELGTYTVAIDTIPPHINIFDQRNLGRNGKISIYAHDSESGISSYRGTIDGKYALFGKRNSLQNNLEYQLDAEHVEKGKQHTLEMTVTDRRGNSITKEYSFYW